MASSHQQCDGEEAGAKVNYDESDDEDVDLKLHARIEVTEILADGPILRAKKSKVIDMLQRTRCLFALNEWQVHCRKCARAPGRKCNLPSRQKITLIRASIHSPS